MKKIFKNILCLIVCLVVVAIRVDAATLSIGNDTTTAGASRSVTVELVDDGNNLAEFTEVSFQLSISGTAYATIDSFTPSTSGLNLNISGNEPKTYEITKNKDDLPKGGPLFAAQIGTINYKTTGDLVGDFKITPTNVVFRKADGSEFKPGINNEVKITEGTVKFEKPKSKEAFLTTLTVSQGTMTPDFKSDIFEYTVVVKDTINMVKVSGTTSAGATRTGGGNVSLQMGSNEVELIVTAEDGETKNTYKLNIVRGAVAEPSAYLKSLEINNIGVALSPAFDKNNNKYTVKVGKDITELNFLYEREDDLAEVTIDGNKNFVDGENPVTITVVSSDGEAKQIYEITVIKGEEDKEEEKPTEPVDEPKKDEKKNNLWIIIIIVVVILAIVIGISIVLFKKKKEKDKIDKTEKTTKKGESQLPLKKRAGDEPTYEIDRISDLEKEKFEQESVTDILKGELFDDDKTQKFAIDSFKESPRDDYDEDEDDKTKEFNFKDFE